MATLDPARFNIKPGEEKNSSVSIDPSRIKLSKMTESDIKYNQSVFNERLRSDEDLLKQAQSKALLSTFYVDNGKLKTDKNKIAQSKGFSSNAELEAFKTNKPELYEAMGGINYFPQSAPVTDTNKINLSNAAVNKIVNRFSNSDFKEVQGIIDTLNTGEWQDADTMKKYSDKINSYANDYVALNELGYFDSVPKADRKEYVNSLKGLKEYVNGCRDYFAKYTNVNDFNKVAWNDKYGSMTWAELEAAEQKIKDKLLKKTDDGGGSLREFQYIKSLREGFENAEAYNNYVKMINTPFDELTKKFLETRRDLDKYNDIEESRQVSYAQQYSEHATILRNQGYSEEDIYKMLTDDSDGYFKMLKDAEENLQIDEKYGGIDALRSQYALLEELYYRGYSNEKTADMILSAIEDSRYSYYVEEGKKKLKRNKYMTDTEYDVACYYKAKGGKDSEKYLEEINDEIQRREIKDRQQRFASFADAMPILSSIASVPLNIIAAGEQVVDTAKFVATGEMDYNTNALGTSTIRNTVSKKIDNPIGSFTYNTTMSGADSLASMGLSKVITGSDKLGSIILGLSAAGNATNDAINRGLSDGYAFASGVAAGVFETLFESWSIGKFSEGVDSLDLADLKNISNFVGKNIWNNALEEDLTEVANIVYDILVNGKYSQYETSIKNYMISGFSEDVAKRKVAFELAGQVGEAAASGALMGFGFSGAGAAKTSIVNKNIRRAIASATFGQSQESVYALVDNGLAMPEGSAAYSQALKADARLKSGKNLSGTTLYNLATAIESEIETKSTTRFNELGVDKKTAKELAPIVAKAVFGESLSVPELSALNNSEIAAQVVKELSADRANTVWKDTIKNSRINNSTDSNAVNEQGEVLQLSDANTVDSIDYLNYNYGNIKEGESYAEDYQRTMGSFGRENREDDTRGRNGKTKENAKITRELGIAFKRRTKETYGDARRLAFHLNTAIAYKVADVIDSNSPAGMAYNILKSKGHNVVYCDGVFELNNGIKTIEVSEAITLFDGTIYISSEATLNGKGIVLHEVVHVWQYDNRKEYVEYEDILSEEIDRTSKLYEKLAEEINDNHYGGKLDVEDISSFKYIIKELAAYINQYVNIDIYYARYRFGGAFRNFEKVVQAVYNMNDKLGFGDIIKEATSKDGVASFNSEEKQVNDADEFIKGLRDEDNSSVLEQRDEILQSSADGRKYFDDGSGDEYFGEPQGVDAAEDIYKFDNDTISSFDIEKMNDTIHVQERVFDTLLKEGFFKNSNERKTIVKNKPSGMVIEINKSGIRETFNYHNFTQMPHEIMVDKLALIRNLPMIIENGKLYDDNVKNIHRKKTSVSYAYIVQNVKINGVEKVATVIIRKSPQKNKFWALQIDIKNNIGSTPAGISQNSITGLLTSNVSKSLSQNSKLVNKENNLRSFDLTEPSVANITRAPTAQEAIEEAITGRQKTNIQRHITDVCKKLDSNVTVEFSNDIEGNGKFIRSQNKILIRSDLSAAQMYVEVFKHEFMHRLETKQLYSKFFNFCFKKSKAFEQYVRAELKTAGVDYNVDTATREGVLQAYTYYKYEQYKNSRDIPKNDRDAFTMENAKEEIIADFFAQILFQGKQYRARIIEALQNADGEALIGIGDEVSSEAALMELQEKEPTLFEQVLEWFKYVINKLRGLPQAKSLVEQLDNEINLLESMVRRAYQSKDSKRLMKKKLTDEKYSIINLDTGKSYVQASRQVISGNSVADWRSQISEFFNKSLKNGPIEITTIEGDILTISKDTANKARDKHISENGVTRELTNKEFLVKLNAEAHIDELAEISISKKDKNENKKIVLDNKNHDIAKDGFTYRTVYFQDFDDAYYRVTLSVGENNGISTVYNVGKIKADDIPNGNIVSAIGSKADMSSTNYSILNPTKNVKQKDVFGFKIDENAIVNEDLLEDVSYYHPDAEVDAQGNITVYHRTTKENAEKINRTGIMTAKEDALFFSSKESGYASDYGDTVVKLKIPSTELQLNDIFDGEVHFDLPLKYKNGGYSLDVSKYLIESNDNSNDTPLGQYSLGSPIQQMRYDKNAHQSSSKYWYPNMTKKEIALVKQIARRELNTTDNYIDNKNKWLYNKFGDKTYFALYSTEDTNEPTVLYACKGDRAEFEYWFLIEDYLEMDDNDESVYRQSEIVGEIFSNNDFKQGRKTFDNGDALGRGSDTGDAGLYIRNTRRRPSEALRDCLRNIREIQERDGRGLGRRLNNSQYSLGTPIQELKYSGEFELSESAIGDIEISEETKFLDGLSGDNLNKTQLHIVDICKQLDFGLTVEFVDNLKTNGKFIRSQNKILIRSDLSAVQMYVEVFKHEFMHRLETKQLYSKFLNFCFKKSKAFEQYVRTELKTAGFDVDAETREGVLQAYTDYKYEQYKNSRDIPKNDRDAFTMENAQEEIIADFFAQILFQGKQYRERIISALENADGEALIGLGDEVSSEAALMELQEKEPTLFEQVVQWFKDVINKLRGLPQAKSLVDQLDNEINQLEIMARRAYQSKDSKRLVKKKLTDEKYSFEGYEDDGKGKYKSNFPKGTTKSAKGERILNYIQKVWSKKPIRLKITENNNTRYITAKFDPSYDESGNLQSDASKLMGGNRHGTSAEQRVTLDLADDYYQIASESTYNYSKKETGKDNPTHKDVKVWHYFVNNIYFAEYDSDEYIPYRVSINIKERADGEYFYSFSAEKQRESDIPRTLHAAVNVDKNTNANVKLSNNKLSQKSQFVNIEGDTSSFDLTEPDIKGIEISEETKFLDGLNGDNLNKTQLHIVDICKQLDSSLTIEFSNDIEGNGKFIRSQNKILIRSDLSAVQMYVEVFKHEFMHRLETKQLYSKFFDYCFKKSKAFEQYVRAELKSASVDLDVDTATREGVIEAYTDYKYKQYKNSGDIPQKDRDAFTMENAKEEIIADFFAEILFQGKRYRERIISALENADGEMFIGIGDEASSEAALLELQQKEPTLFERVLEWFRDVINKLRGLPQAKSLVEQLDNEINMLESMVRRAYQSKDSKRLMNKKLAETGVKYSVTREDVRSWNIDWDSNNESSLKEQLRQHLKDINSMEPVADVVYSKQSKKTYYQVLDELLRDKFGYKIQRKEYGTILFDSDAIEDARNYINNDAEAAAMIAAPYVLKRGKAISGHKNHKGKGNVTVTFAAPVVLNKKVGNVAVSVMYGKGKVHSLRVLTPEGTTFELLKIKDTESTITGRSQNATVDPYIDSVSNNNIPNSTENVNTEKSNDNSNDNTSGKYSLGSPIQQKKYSEFNLNEPNIDDIEISEETKFLDGLSGENLNKTQLHIVDIANTLNPEIRVEFVNGLKTNGKFIRSQNKILIRSDLSAVQMYVEVFKHEFMHRLETKQLYSKFFNFCFKKSKAFEQYVRAELKTAGVDYNVDTATREGVLQAYTDYKYEQYKNSRDIPKNDRDAFTMEMAQQEIIADFFAEILFQGKRYRERIISALENADGEMLIGIGDEVSSEAALMELQEKEPTLFEQVVQWFKDVINKLRGLTQAKTVVSNLENELNQLESMVTRAYQSRDSKRLVSEKLDEEKYSIKQSFYAQLDNWDKETIGFSFVVGTTSDALLKSGVPNKQIRWDASKIKTLLNKHIGMDIEIVRQIPELLENPVVVIDSKKNHNSRIAIGELKDNNGKLVTVVLLLTPTSKKGNQLDVIKISSAQGRGHIESLFKNDNGSFVKIWYIDKKRIQSWLNVNGLQLPLHRFNLDSNNIIPTNNDFVNNEDSKRLMKKKLNNIKYSIKKSIDGQYYVEVENNIIIEKNDGKNIAKILSDIVKIKFKDFINVSRQKIGLNGKTVREWQYSKDAQYLLANSKQLYIDKLNAFNNADELLIIAKNYVGEAIKHERKDNFVEFARGTVDFKVSNRGYSADVIVGTTKSNVTLLYDIVGLQKKVIEETSHTAQDRRAETTSINNIISNSIENINTQKRNDNSNDTSSGQYSLGSPIQQMIYNPEAYAKHLNRKYQSKADSEAVAKKIKQIVAQDNRSAKAQEETRQKVYDREGNFVGELTLKERLINEVAVEIAKNVVLPRDEYADEVISYIDEDRLYVDRKQRLKIRKAYGKLTNYYKTVGIKLSDPKNPEFDENWVSLTDAWEDWVEAYPELFSSRISTENMPLRLAEIMEYLNSLTEDFDYEGAADDIAEHLYSVLDESDLHTKNAEPNKVYRRFFAELYREKMEFVEDNYGDDVDEGHIDVDNKSVENYNYDTHYGERIYDTPQHLKPSTDREWQAFCRSFANKTSGALNDKIITIFTADNYYKVKADGYMSGIIFQKVNIENYKRGQEFYDSLGWTETAYSQDGILGNRQNDYGYGSDIVGNEERDIGHDELDEFIDRHPEWFADRGKSYADYRRESDPGLRYTIEAEQQALDENYTRTKREYGKTNNTISRTEQDRRGSNRENTRVSVADSVDESAFSVQEDEPGNKSYCFIKSNDTEKISIAEKMEAEGKDSLFIWRELKIFRGIFGDWLKTINADSMRFYPNGNAKTEGHTRNPHLKKQGRNIEGKLSDFLLWKQLYNIYPEFEDTAVVLADSSYSYDTVRYMPARNALVINKKLCEDLKENGNRDVKAYLMREIQRMIQIEEGKYIGKSRDYWLNLEQEGKLPFSKQLNRYLTADDMMKYFIDNYEAEMAAKRQIVGDLVHQTAKQKITDLDDLVLYMPYIEPDKAIMFDTDGNLVTVKENDELTGENKFKNYPYSNSDVSRATLQDGAAVFLPENNKTQSTQSKEETAFFNGLWDNKNSVVDNEDILNYNKNNINGGEEYDIFNRRGTYGDNSQSQDINSRKEAGMAGVYEETTLAFERRVRETYKGSRRTVSHLNIAVAYKEANKVNINSPAGIAYNILKSKGYNVVYCDGAFLINNGKETFERNEAVTISDGTVYISSNATLDGTGITLHEVVHVWQYTHKKEYIQYYNTLCEEINLVCKEYADLAHQINNNHFGGKYDVDDISSFEYIMRELTAYINQYVCIDQEYAKYKFGGIFKDWDNVVQAVYRMNSQLQFGDIINKATSDDGAAVFLPQNNKTQSTQSEEETAFFNGLWDNKNSVVDNEDILKYNKNNINGGEENVIYKRRGLGPSNEGTDGTVNSGTEEGVAGIYGETTLAFKRRVEGIYGNSGRAVSHLNITVAYKKADKINENSSAGIAYNILKSKGYNVVYCDGAFLINNGKETFERNEAVTISDGTVYISSNATLDGTGIALHEVVHVWQYNSIVEYANYESVLCEELDHMGEEYIKAAKKINNNHFDGRYDVEAINSFKPMLRELAAYINQYVCIDQEYAKYKFGGIFKDWDNVVQAVYRMNSQLQFGDIINKATSDDGAAFVLSDNVVENGETTAKVKNFVASNKKTRAEQQKIRKDSKIKGGNSGFAESDNASRDISRLQYEAFLLSKCEIPVSSQDTIGRKLETAVQNKLFESFAKNEKGEPISLYVINRYGDNLLRHEQLGIVLGTIDAAIQKYQAQNADSNYVVTGVCEEYYAILKKPLYMPFEPYELSVGEIGFWLTEEGILTREEYFDMADSISATKKPRYYNAVTKRLRKKLKELGYDCIVYKNQKYDAGSLSVVILDDTQLIPVAKDGVLIEDSGITGGEYAGTRNETVTAKTNTEMMRFFSEDAAYTRRKNRKKADNRIMAGGSGWLEPKDTDPDREYDRTKQEIVGKSQIEYNPYANPTRVFGNLIVKEFENTVFKTKDGDYISFYMHAKDSRDAEEIVKQGLEFESFNGAFDHFAQQKKINQYSANGVFTEYILNAVNPLLVRLNGWNTKQMATWLFESGKISQMYYNDLMSLETVNSDTYTNYAAKKLRSKIDMLGYDCIIFVKDNGEKSVIVFDTKQILPVSQNGILNQNNGITQEQDTIEELVSDEYKAESVVIDKKGRPERNIDEIKDKILSEPDNTKKLKILTEYLECTNKPVSEDTDNINVGYSGLLEKAEANVWNARSRVNELIANTVPLADTDTANRAVAQKIQSEYKNTILKDNDGRLLSLFIWNKYGENRHRHSAFAYNAGTLTFAHDNYLAEKQKHPALKKGVYEEYYANITNAYLMTTTPKEFTAMEIATDMYESGVLNKSEYRDIISREGAEWSHRDNNAVRRLKQMAFEKGINAIVYMNSIYDPGSIGVIPIDESNLTLVSVDGKTVDTDKNVENVDERGYNENIIDGLTKSEKAKIKEKTGWSYEIVDYIRSMAEAQIYINANLIEAEINSRKCLIRNDIDMEQMTEFGVTNKHLTKSGLAPFTTDDKKIELHHIGQKQDSPLAELTKFEHRSVENYAILHNIKKKSELNRSKFDIERKQHWIVRGN